MSDVLTCAACEAKNRVRVVPEGQEPACARCGAALPWLHGGSDATFNQDVRAPVPVLVEFWAPWCGPCRVMGPVLEDVARERAGKVRVVKVNVDENPQSAARSGVRSIPTLLLMRGGEVADTVVGTLPKSALLGRLAALAE